MHLRFTRLNDNNDLVFLVFFVKFASVSVPCVKKERESYNISQEAGFTITANIIYIVHSQ